MLGFVRSFVAALALGAALLLAPAGPPHPVPADPAPVAYTKVADRYESRVVYWTNQKRRQHGLDPVRALACADRVSESWMRHLAARGEFYHQDLSRAMNCPGATAAGENLAKGAISPRRAVRLWMASPGHRRNLLNPRYTHIGVGAGYTTGTATITTVQVFIGR